MQDVMFTSQQVGEQYVIIVLNELSCHWSICQYRPAWTPWWTTALIRLWSYACCEAPSRPGQYSNLARTTDRKTARSPWSFILWEQSTLMTCSDSAHLRVTYWTCSLTDVCYSKQLLFAKWPMGTMLGWISRLGDVTASCGGMFWTDPKNLQRSSRSKELIHGVLHGSALHATGPSLCYVISLINLNLSLTNSGSTKILCIMYKDKIHAGLYIIKISYIGYQYFVGFAFVMQA